MKNRSFRDFYTIKEKIDNDLDISDKSLVTLVVIYNKALDSIDEFSEKELTMFNFINENKEITENGLKYLDKKETIEKLKKIIG